MVNGRVNQLREAVGGVLVCGDPQTAFTSVSTDTRRIGPGAVFFALEGARFDAHRFLGAAKAAGAAAAVISRDPALFELGDWPLVLVPDTLAAFGRLGRWHRERSRASVVAITGSAGKSTTKEFTAQLLAGSFPGVKAPRSFNNAVGVPATLLELQESDRFCVVEVGTNNLGEIESLAALVKPDIAVVTCIGEAHLERFGSRFGVAWEKGHLVAALPAGGLAVLNADDPWCRRLADLARGRVASFGESARAQVRIRDVDDSGDGISFRVDGQSFALPVNGRHNALNAAAAIAVAREFGLPLCDLAERARSVRLPPMRMELRRHGDLTIIADEYNASPTSVSAALGEFGRMACRGRKVAILGDMLELGPRAAALHRRVGERAAREDLGALWTIGSLARYAALAARRRGMADAKVQSVPDTAAGCNHIPDWIRPDDTVLLKGSRGMGLEKVVAAIEQRFGAAAGVDESSDRQNLFDSFRITAPDGSGAEGAQ